MKKVRSVAHRGDMSGMVEECQEGHRGLSGVCEGQPEVK